jgi:phenylpropionate dioxygenase-like ring-hydroxylating dioxygenase large terminal subunit
MSEAAQTAMENLPESGQERGAEADLGFLWDFWYPAIRSDAIHGRRLISAMLLEVPLVLGRTTEGKAFAMRDTCPHRGIPLSYGHFDGKKVQCCYHGWEFDACSGRCVAIPSLTGHDKLKIDRISAVHFPCEERDGYVWVFMNAPGMRLPERGHARTAEVQREIQDHAARLRAAVAHRPRNYRVNGPRARPVRAPVVVLAQQEKHSRKVQAI